MTPPRTLVIHAPTWPVDALGVDPAQPFAIVDRGWILATTPPAWKMGVRPGQRRREATWHCPHLEIAPRDEGAERRAFTPLLLALERFGALVTVRAPGWAWIGTRGPARYFGGEADLALEVARALGWEQGGSHPGVGVADGPFAATLAARRGVVVPSAETATFLAPFGVEELGAPELAEVLRTLGVATLGAFAALGRPEVLARFGRHGGRAHAVASGEEEAAPPTPPTREIAATAEVAFEEPSTRVEEVILAARRLAEELCTRVRAAGLAFSLLTVTAESDDAEQCVRQWSHDGPFTSTLVVERVRWQLESWMRPDHDDESRQVLSGVVFLRVAAEELLLDTGRQDTLFGRSSAVEERVVRAFGRVQGMVGPAGVLQAILVGGRDPATQVELFPFGDRRSPSTRPFDRPWPGRLPPPSPALVFVEPLPIEVLDGDGALLAVDARGEISAPPAILAVDGRRSEITAWAGPWPVDERWWETGRRRRARFQLVVDDEVLLVALERGRFLLEGRYD